MTTDHLEIEPFSEATIFGGNSSVRNRLADLPCQVSSIAALNAEVVRPLGTDKAKALGKHLQTRFGEADLLNTFTLGNGEDAATMLARSAFGIATHDADPSALASADLCLTVSVGRFLMDLDARPFAASPGASDDRLMSKQSADREPC